MGWLGNLFQIGDDWIKGEVEKIVTGYGSVYVTDGKVKVILNCYRRERWSYISEEEEDRISSEVLKIRGVKSLLITTDDPYH